MKQRTDSPVALRRRRRRARAVSAPLSLRVSVYLTRGRLDRRIVSDWPCEFTPQLGLRVLQLIDPRTRRSLARGLRGKVEFVDRMGSRPNFSAVVIERPSVRVGREAILGLAERLDGSDPVCPRGIVLVQTLLTDGCGSPLFSRYAKQSMFEAVWEVADALDPEGYTVEFGAFTG